jgi:glutathione S-transferase
MSKPAKPIKLHGFKLSGHSHRVELMLHLLDLPYDFQSVDLPAGEHKKPAFLALNPFGQVPVIEDDGVIIADSVAILVYLASKYDPAHRWLPLDPVAAADVQRWLSVAQGAVFNGVNKTRLVKLFGRPLDYAQAKEVAEAFLIVLQAHLATRDYLCGPAPTIADVALYSYVAVAPEGEISLSAYPAVTAWLGRFEQLPRFLPMPRSKPAQAA